MAILKSKTLIKMVIVETILICILMYLLISLYTNYAETYELINNVLTRSHEYIIVIKSWLLEMLRSIVKEYHSVEKIFNNRELAVIIWIAIALIGALASKKFRKPALDLIKASFSKPLIKMVFRLLIYCALIIFLLDQFAFWNIALLKPFILWFITVALVTSYRAFNKIKDISYFYSTLRDNIKLTIFIEFLANLYAFSLVIELISFPIMIFISFMISTFDTSQVDNIEMSNFAKSFLQWVVAIVGFYYLYRSIVLMIGDWDDIDKIGLMREIVLPIIMSSALVIFNYLYVVKAKYEVLFIRLSFKKTIEDKYRWYLKFRIIFLCKLSVKRIDSFIEKSQVMLNYINSYKEVNNIINNYKNYKTSTESIT